MTAGNSVGSATQAFTIVVDQLPAITGGPPGTGMIGAAYAFQYTASGSPAPSLSLGSGASPAGLTLNAAGSLTGTPTVSGSFTGTVVAANGAGLAATQSFVLTIDQPPAITSVASATFAAAALGAFTVTDVGVPGASLTETGILPIGVRFNAATGVLSGTPLANAGGAYSLHFTAANGVGANATQTFVLLVDQAPGITSAAATTFTAGAAGSFAVTTSGYPAVTLSEAGGALPAGVTFNAGSGTLGGAPAGSAGGVYPLEFIAVNGVNPAAAQYFTLSVRQAPAITSAASATFNVGAAGSFTVTYAGYPAAALSEAVPLPSGVVFNPATDVLAGTPAPGTGGTYNLSFSALNGVGATATQSFVLTIDQAPIFTSTASTIFTVGSPASFTVATTAVPASTTLKLAGGTLPAGVTFTDNHNGTARWPAPRPAARMPPIP